MKNALEKEDLYKFAELLNEETEERAKLNPEIVPPKIKEMITLAKKMGQLQQRFAVGRWRMHFILWR